MRAHFTRKHFVEFLYPAGFFCNTMTREIDERDPAKVAVPENAFCFTFYDLIVGYVIDRGEKIKVSSVVLDRSPKYYYGGKVYTVEEVKKQFPDEIQRISRLEGNDDKHVIICRTGNWMRFEEEDVFLEIRK